MQSNTSQAAQGLLSNPLFGMGIGLLSGANRGGTFAGGAQAGLMNAMGMQRQQQEIDVVKQKAITRDLQQQEIIMGLADQRQRRERVEKLRGQTPGWLGTQAQQGTPAGVMPHQYDQMEGEQQIPGLLNQTAPAQPGQAATGMFASNPQLAGLLNESYQNDPEGMTRAVSDAAVESMFAPGAKASSDMQNYEYQVKVLGIDPDTAHANTFGQSSGTNITMPNVFPSGYDETGRPIISTKGEETGRGATTERQKGAMEGMGTLQNLNEISEQFDTSFLTYQGQLEAGKNRVLDKLGLSTTEQQERLGEYAAFRTQTIGALNSYIKSITGAAMSEKEAERIMNAFPNMKMSPVEFKNAFDEIYRDTGRSLLRYELIGELGLTDYIGLTDVKGLESKLNMLYEKRTQENITAGNTPEMAKQMAFDGLNKYIKFLE